MWSVEATGSEGQAATSSQLRREETTYLTDVIKSGLGWIEDEGQREEVWEAVSKRLSERCGRAAMGEMVRRWPFDGAAGGPVRSCHPRAGAHGRPARAEDVGLVVRAGADARQVRGGVAVAPAVGGRDRSGLSVLELGSGTGLLGLAAAAIWRADVVLSDLPAIVPNLAFNSDRNRDTVASHGGRTRVGPLTWGGAGAGETDPALFGTKNQFKVRRQGAAAVKLRVLVPAADRQTRRSPWPQTRCTTTTTRHSWPAPSAIQLSAGAEARALVMVPRRDDTTVALLATFKDRMAQHALACVEEGSVAGRDDWGDGHETYQVECWWGVFARRAEEHAAISHHDA